MGQFIDLTGQKFGRLTVIKRVENDKNNNVQWLCQCDCGKENSLKVVQGRDLKSGHTKSCGCLQQENRKNIHKKYNTYNLSGEYGTGYTTKGEEFYFDLEDYNLIKHYCWLKDKSGYIITSVNENDITYMHRLVTNCPNNMQVDHIFHNLYDNRKDFLRIVTRSQNSMNQKLSIKNTSGVKGVYWNKEKDKWQAQIQVNSKTINLGRYDDFDEAVEVRREAEIKYFGEYRYIENPQN